MYFILSSNIYKDKNYMQTSPFDSEKDTILTK